MKKLSILFSIILLFLSSISNSTTWIVNVSNFAFSPSNLPGVIVGDTIKWQWVSGDHTTTSLTIPAGAPDWDSPISSGTQTFSYIIAVPGNYSYKCTPHFPGMEGSFTANIIGITPISGEVPERFNLSQNYPNPFNPLTNIIFDIPKSSFVKLSVFSILGKQVHILVNQQLNPGIYNADWNASDYPSGVYFYKLETESFTNTKRMILLK